MEWSFSRIDTQRTSQRPWEEFCLPVPSLLPPQAPSDHAPLSWALATLASLLLHVQLSAWDVFLHLPPSSLSLQLSELSLSSQGGAPTPILSCFLHPPPLLYIFRALITIWLITYFNLSVCVGTVSLLSRQSLRFMFLSPAPKTVPGIQEILVDLTNKGQEPWTRREWVGEEGRPSVHGEQMLGRAAAKWYHSYKGYEIKGGQVF